MQSRILVGNSLFQAEYLAMALNVGTVLFITLGVYIFYKFFSKRLISYLVTTKRNWDDAFVIALSVPLNCLIWLVGIEYGLYLIQQTCWPNFDPSIFYRFFNFIFGILLVWFFFRFIRHTQHNLITVQPSGKTVDVTTVYAVTKFAQLTAAMAGILIIMGSLNIPVSGIIAFGGGSALVVGIAAQSLLANFFGSFIILLDKPFKVGDHIRSPEKEIEGTVNYIGWRQTHILTLQKNPLYVPNSVFMSAVVENLSRRSNRRIRQTVRIRYCDIAKVDLITQDIHTMLMQHEEIDINQSLVVNLENFGPSSLDILINTFTKTKDWVIYSQVQQDILLKVTDIITKHQAEIALPTMTVALPDGTVSRGA